MINFQIAAVGRDAPHDDPYFDTLLRNVGTFVIKVRERVFFSEEDFTVVELAASFEAWRSLSDEERPPYRYLATEADEPLLEFKTEDGVWTIDSPLKLYPETEVFQRNDLDAAIGRYLRRLEELSSNLEGDVEGVLREESKLILLSQFSPVQPR